ncbi:MAG: sigma-54-dependent Fis family transcriptional regulator, partial [Planctomycetes bacterium]|nr:sigma-54-dependent Fis family transcriptional regulator [Planctomycetota bacterium]
HDLTNLVEEKKFRQDLYFRIKGVSVSVPPLRQRREDIPLLADFFLKEAVGETGSKVAGFTDAAANILASYEWPGNIRQLRNVIRTMVVMSDRDKLDVQDLPPEINRVRQLPGGSTSLTTGQAKSASDMPLNEIERQAIIDTLAKTGNNREKAAKLLGIGERTLYRKIKEYNL